MASSTDAAVEDISKVTLSTVVTMHNTTALIPHVVLRVQDAQPYYLYYTRRARADLRIDQMRSDLIAGVKNLEVGSITRYICSYIINSP
jgi:hypothetical protein